MRRLRILHMIRRAESRCLNIVAAQKSCGQRVSLAFQEIHQAHKGLLKGLRISRKGDKYDIVHYHAQRHEEVLSQQEIGDGAVVVYDVHDLHPPQINDLYTQDASYIVPSEGYAAYFGNHRSVLVVPPKVSRKFWPKEELRQRTKLDATALTAYVHPGELIRDYRWAHDQLEGNLFIFQASDIPRIPGTLHLNIFPVQEYQTVLNKLTLFKHGWACAANDRHEINICQTRKLYEYIAAGALPITSYERSREMHLLRMGGERVTCPLTKNDPRTMESEVPKMIDFYKQEIAYADARTP